MKVGDFVCHRRWGRYEKTMITYRCIVTNVYEKETAFARDRLLLGAGEWYCDLLSLNGETLISIMVSESEIVKEES